MTNRERIQRLQALVVAGQKAQAAVDSTIEALQLRQPTREDRDILQRLPIAVQANYRHGDQWDATNARARLKYVGSFVDAVGLEENTRAIRERRTEVDV